MNWINSFSNSSLPQLTEAVVSLAPASHHAHVALKVFPGGRQADGAEGGRG